MYDKRSILAKGLKAKTNFDYTKKQLERLLQNKNDLCSSDLNKDDMDVTLEI